MNSPGTGRTRRPIWRWAVDLVLIAAAVVSVLLEPVSIAWHSVIGLVFAGFRGRHLWHRRAWIRGTLRRLWQRRTLSRALRWSLSQAGLLLLLTMIVTASGLWDWLDGRTTIRWHAISSVILLAVLIRHTWTRRRRLLHGGPGRPAGPVRLARPLARSRASAFTVVGPRHSAAATGDQASQLNVQPPSSRWPRARWSRQASITTG